MIKWGLTMNDNVLSPFVTHIYRYPAVVIFFILNRMEFWNLLLITKKILIEFHTFFLFFWCCKELNRCINTIKWSCLKKISMAGCLQVLILTFVVYLRSRGNNFTLIFELITIQTCQTLYKHCICYYQDFGVLRHITKEINYNVTLSYTISFTFLWTFFD